VVIAIIAVLAAILAPAAFRAMEKSKISACIADLRAIKSAAYAFYTDTDTLPCPKCGGWGKDPGFVQPITASNCWPNEGGCSPGCTDLPGWDGPYLEKWPLSSPWHILYGGLYNWNRWSPLTIPGTGKTCSLAGVVTLEAQSGAIPIESLQKIDKVLDNGDLDSENVYQVIAGTNLYLNYVVACF
jgi:general secretion pathway protein G